MKVLYFVYQWLIFVPLLIIVSIFASLATIIGCWLGNKNFWGYWPGVIWARCIIRLSLCPVTVEGRENINKETVNVLNTALRLGMDFDTVALLLSTKAVTNVLNAYRRNSLIAKTSFDAEIKKAIRELEKNPAIGKDSPLQQQNLTIEEMVNAVNNPTVETAYKILNALRGLSEISKTAQPLTDLSRLNSITSAPGPLYINTISSDRKVGPQISMKGIVKIRTAYKDATDTPVGIGSKVRNDDIVGDEYIEITEDNLEELLNRGTISAYEEYEDATREMVFDELPSLRAFYESYNIVKDLFKKLNFTTASAQFQKVLDVVPDALQFTLYTVCCLTFQLHSQILIKQTMEF